MAHDSEIVAVTFVLFYTVSENQTVFPVFVDLEVTDFLYSMRTHHATEKDAAHYHTSNKSKIVMHVSFCVVSRLQHYVRRSHISPVIFTTSSPYLLLLIFNY